MSSPYAAPSARRPLNTYRERIGSPSPCRKEITLNETSEDSQSDTDEYYTEVNKYYHTPLDISQEESANLNIEDNQDRITTEETDAITQNESNQLKESNINSTCTQTAYFSTIRTAIVAVLVMLPALYLACNGQISVTNKPPSRRNCSFDSLQLKYPSEDEFLWKSLKIGIENVLNKYPPMPVVYLFLHPNSSLSQGIVQDIAGEAAKCFDHNKQPIELTYEDFTSKEAVDDYGMIIEKFKNIVGDGGSLIIPNLNEISGNTARALHAICDTYSPIISNLAIFMTLVPLKYEGNNMQIAEDTLEEIWGDELLRSDLDPLITRVTDQVYYLRSK